MAEYTKTEITLPFRDFLEILLGPNAHSFIEEHLAYLIQAKDKDECFVHVEFPDKLNKLSKPKVWYIQEWRTSVQHYSSLKKQQDENNQKSFIAAANIDRLCRVLMTMTYLDREAVIPIATEIVLKNKTDVAEKFGVKLEQWKSKDE